MLERNLHRWCRAGTALGLGLMLVAMHGCSRSSGTPIFDRQGTLIGLTFPDPFDVNIEDEALPPQNAPLVQQVVFEFTGRPNPNQVNSENLPIVDSKGEAVDGSYEVDGKVVTFTPALPTRAPRQRPDGTWTSGGAGLLPERAYELRLALDEWSFLVAIDPALLALFPDPDVPGGIFVRLQTTGDSGLFFRGLRAKQPALISTSPADGAMGVSPQLYSDPAGIFPPSEGFLLTFDAPLSPYEDNFEAFSLADLDASPSGAGLDLAADATLVENGVSESVVLVRPSGILHFGHLHALGYPGNLRPLQRRNSPAAEDRVASTFTTADTALDVVEDLLTETYQNRKRRASDGELAEELRVPADWDEENSNLVQAAAPFIGTGALGRFIPSPGDEEFAPRRVTLDTDLQVLPLLDGSTPDVRPDTVVEGGIFEFTEIDIPDGVEVYVTGSNPLVLRATGSVRIGGWVDVSGAPGLNENAFDSAISSVPGGPSRAGGGRGGDGHPVVYFPPDQLNIDSLVSPSEGGAGWTAFNATTRGGRGGVCGTLDHADGGGEYGTDAEVSCAEFSDQASNGWKAPGGGGGSFLTAGKLGPDGVGNVTADGMGMYLVSTPQDGADFDVLRAGVPGDAVFSDSDTENDYIGRYGEYTAARGGQGGGGGGSGLHGYYCGAWCLLDADASNDALCQSEFGNPPQFADSVGDARGGGGGAGGGALVIDAVGSILVTSTGRVLANGGAGGGGEALGCGNWAGNGAGGSGGAILFQSADEIVVRANAEVNAEGGRGSSAVESTDYITSCGGRNPRNPGSGGDGGFGLIQFRVPEGTTAQVHPDADIDTRAWVDEDNTRHPSEFNGMSTALSDWFDVGRMIVRRGGASPNFFFTGTDLEGFVRTDDEGNVLDPAFIRCVYPGIRDDGYPVEEDRYLPGEEPRENFIPLNARVRVEFQGASALVEGSKEVDASTLTEWSASPSIADGLQFVRTRITFDVAANEPLMADSRRPAVDDWTVAAEY